jgi:hypothetical protein
MCTIYNHSTTSRRSGLSDSLVAAIKARNWCVLLMRETARAAKICREDNDRDRNSVAK